MWVAAEGRVPRSPLGQEDTPLRVPAARYPYFRTDFGRAAKPDLDARRIQVLVGREKDTARRDVGPGSYRQRELDGGPPVTLEQDGFDERSRVGAFCDFACAASYIEDRALTDVDPTPPQL